MATAAPISERSRRLQVLNALLGRTLLASQLGYQYGGDRDVYTALGYKTALTYTDYAVQYERQDIAKAIIDRPVNAMWQGGVSILEMDDDEETELESAWGALDDRMGLVGKFVRLDKLASLGSYGGLLLGFDDVQDKYAMERAVASGKRQLLYAKPLTEASARVAQYEIDSNSERYGLPAVYSVTLKHPSGQSDLVRVHSNRIIHVTGELLESEVDGVPVLRAVYNRLQDLEKLVGASAEMFWRGARPGYQAEVKDDYQLTPTAQDDLQDQIDEYEHNLRRILALEGVTFSPLAMQVADPRWHVDMQLQMIAAVTGIPKRILVGAERGELASTEDRSAWLDLLQARRDSYAELQIVRPFVDRCIEYGVLPRPKTGHYTVVWSDLYAMSEQERAEVGKTRSTALKEYASAPTAESIIPPDAFLQYFLGLTDDDVEQIRSVRDAEIQGEQSRTVELEAASGEGAGEGITTQTKGHWGHGGRPGHRGGSVPGGGATSPSEIRSLRAKNSYNPATRDKQRLGEANEKLVASHVGGVSLPDNEPFDVLASGHAVEVKTIVAGKNPKITMHPESLARKRAYANTNGVKTWTVAIDARGVPSTVYVKEGLGSFRLRNMLQLGSMQNLGEVIR